MQRIPHAFRLLLLGGALTVSLNAADKSGVGPNTISLPKGPGAIEGLGESFQPTLNTGTAKYGFSVALPAGTGGQTPGMHLGYEGGAGNGVLGFGWQLPIACIQRRSDRGIPAYGENVGFNRADTFINEVKEELVPQTNGFYFCKNEGAFVRYRFVDNFWEGVLPEGSVLQFGLTDEARVQDTSSNPPHVFSWLLQKDADTHGNVILYSYTNFPGANNLNQKYLAGMTYGPGAPPWNHFYFARFIYEDRPDWFEDCRSGFIVRTGKRLKSILVGVQGPSLTNELAGDLSGDGKTDYLVRRYDLEYLDYAGTNSHWSLLSKVIPVGADGVSTLPATTFGYRVCNPPDTISARGRIIGGTNEPPVVMDNPLVEFIDLNGDGLPDILQTDPGGGAHMACLNRGEIAAASGPLIEWGSPTQVDSADGRAWLFNLQSVAPIAHLADMDGDGIADLAVTALDGSVLYFANRGKLAWGPRQDMSVQDSSPPSPFGDANVRTADLDFDKRIDIIQSVSTGNGADYRIWFNLGAQSYSPGVIVPQANGVMFSTPGVQIADFNGDRVPDVVRVTPTAAVVTAGLGYGRFAEPITVAIPDWVLDEGQVAKSKLCDVNGDGLADLVIERATSTELWYWLNLGNYTFSHRKVIADMPASIGANAVIRWADLNGNGTTDLVYADSSSQPRLQTLDIGRLINSEGTPNILVAISNGIGRMTLIDYQPSTVFSLQDAAAGRPWPDLMPNPVHVVSAMTNLDSLGHNYVTLFRYHNGYYDPGEKQFRGFASAEQIELGDAAAPTLVTRSLFDTGQVYESMKGKLLVSSIEQEDGTVFSVQTNYWSVPPATLYTGTNGTNVLYVHPAGKVTILTELGRGTPRRLESEVAYDNYGNPTNNADYGIVENGDRSAGNDERITTTEYALNLDAWRLRYPKRQETKDLNGTVISRTENYYDDETFSGANLGVVVTGNLTMSKEWVRPGDPNAFVKIGRTKYDAYGNSVVILDPLAIAPAGEVDFSFGHARQITRDSGFHLFPVAETVHVGGGKEPLVFKAAYDEAFGTVISSADFNSNVTFYAYDPFARLAAIVKPGDTSEYPTSEYAYGLAVPVGTTGLVNYVETRLLDQAPGTRTTKLDHYMISREFTDGMGRKLMTKLEAEPSPGGPSPAVVVNGAVTFNARGGVVSELHPFLSLAAGDLPALLDFENIEAPGWRGLFHEQGTLASLDLPHAHQTRSIRDATLREVQSVNPDGTVEATVYEPLLTRAFDANQTDPASPFFGCSVAHYQDGLGRLVKVDESVRLNDDGTPAAMTNTWTTRYQYDLNDRLVRIQDSQGNVKLMAYDGLRRKVSVNDPDRGQTLLVYDDAGNLLETTDAKGQRITRTYDGVNRLATEHYPDNNPRLPSFDPARPLSPANRPAVAYFYDGPAGNLDAGDGTTLTARNTLGLLAYVWDMTGEQHFSYDARSRAVATVRRVPDPAFDAGQGLPGAPLISFCTRFEFDSLDRLTGVTYPDNDQVRYEYNERGHGKRILGGPSGSIVSRMLYSPAAQLTLVEYGNGVQTSSAYDSRLRLTQIRARQLQLGLEHVGLSYAFDSACNLKSIVDTRPASAIPAGSRRRNTQSLGYDDRYRLTQVQYSFAVPGAPLENDGEIHCRYDRVGNLLSQTSDIAHYDRGVSVTQLGDIAYGGAAGRFNRTGRNSADPPGPHAMTSVSQPPTNSSQPRVFLYDPNGNMTVIDGLACTWDSKDRLVRAENNEMVAQYSYDYLDRRVIKTVSPKLPAPGHASQSDATVYLDQYFEMRPNGMPTKYVWNGNTRVAAATGPLSTNELVQRLALRTGWNLHSLYLTAPNALQQLAVRGNVSSVFRWNPNTGGFDAAPMNETLSAGTVVWVRATTNGTVALRGAYTSNPPPSQAPPGGSFHPGWGVLQPLPIDSFAPADVAISRFDAAGQVWQTRLLSPFASTSDLPQFLGSGEALFLRTVSTATLPVPAEAAQIRYYHHDHLGSSAVIADENGLAVEETSFYPFGFPRFEQKSMRIHDPYGFGQKERDEETGFQFFDARYLSSSLGRFIRVDPLASDLKSSWLGEPQRLNLYAYCANSPLNNVDPTGTDLLQAYKGFGIGVAEGVWESIPKDLNPVTMAVSATVGVAKAVEAKSVQYGGVIVETYQGNYKKAAELATADNILVKALDPKTSDQEMGRMLGKETGKALALIATEAAGGGGAAGGGASGATRGAAAGGQLKAGTVFAGGSGKALAGHGNWSWRSGFTKVPEGTRLSVWTKPGGTISEKLGQVIEAGDYSAIAKNPEFMKEIEGAVTHLPGSRVHNYTLLPPDIKMGIFEKSRTVAYPTPLKWLMKPNMGTIDWAACTELANPWQYLRDIGH